MQKPSHLHHLSLATIIGLLLIGPSSAFAERDAIKAQDSSASTTTGTADQKHRPAEPTPGAPADTDSSKSAEMKSSMAPDKDKDDKNQKKKEGCRPGSLALMGVGC